VSRFGRNRWFESTSLQGESANFRFLARCGGQFEPVMADEKAEIGTWSTRGLRVGSDWLYWWGSGRHWRSR
jgi:hypothetical protein